MKYRLGLFTVLISTSLFGQLEFNFEPSPQHPFGLPNPDMPVQMMDWAPLIGECQCRSVSRIDANTWADTTDMIWRFKYIMNGMGVQDETLHDNGKHAGSIRQYIADSVRWYVHYYSSTGPTPTLPAWEGNKNEQGNIVLYRDQKAPNGMAGMYKITFSNISGGGFDWLGEWVDSAQTFSYPTWKIFCRKMGTSQTSDAEIIMENIRAFSAAYVAADYDAIANAYTIDGKIFPSGTPIISGREDIKKRWTITNGSRILSHTIVPEEINIIGDVAYDYGYYEGAIESKEGERSDFKGKYVIVWKKVESEWKIYLDIWNRVNQN